MGKTADKLNYLLETKKAIKDALNSKGLNVADDATFRSYADSIREIETENDSDVRFFDYDGRVVYSYTKDEFLALTELPVAPHKYYYGGIWNFTLSEAQSMVSAYGYLDIGEIVSYYDNWQNVNMPSDNVLIIRATDELSKTLRVNIYLSVNDGVTIYWGDGSSDEYSGTSKSLIAEHTYNEYGEYVAHLYESTNASWSIGKEACDHAVYKIFSRRGARLSVKNCMRLQTIIATSEAIYSYAHEISNCPNLRHIASKGAISVSNCASLRAVSAKEINIGIIDSTEYRLENCPKLTRAIVQLSPHANSSGISSCFRNNTSLQKLVVDSHISLSDNAFYNCQSLRSVYLTENASFWWENTKGAFQNCLLIEEPYARVNNVSEDAYNNCISFKKADWQIDTIGDRAFKGCISLTSLENIPYLSKIGESALEGSGLTSFAPLSRLTTIGAYAFRGCKSLSLIDCRNHTSVPSLGVDAFASTSTSLIIVVPDSLYDEWIAAENWSTYASQIVKASEYNG